MAKKWQQERKYGETPKEPQKKDICNYCRKDRNSEADWPNEDDYCLTCDATFPWSRWIDLTKTKPVE